MKSFSCIEECMTYTRMSFEDRIAVTFAKEIFNGEFISAIKKHDDNDWKEFVFVPPVIEPKVPRGKKTVWLDAETIELF